MKLSGALKVSLGNYKVTTKKAPTPHNRGIFCVHSASFKRTSLRLKGERVV